MRRVRSYNRFDEPSLVRAVDQLAKLGVEAVAVCLLHAYANPTHERKIAAMPETEAARSAGQSFIDGCSGDP